MGRRKDCKASSRSGANLTTVVQVLEKLPLDKHINALDRTPFRHLIRSIKDKTVDLNRCKMNHNDITTIINSYDRETGRFQIGDVGMKLQEEDVRVIFGIVDGNKKIKDRLNTCRQTDFLQRFFPERTEKDRLRKWMIATKLRHTDNSEDFARLTTLYILATLLAPTKSGNLAWSYTEFVDDLDMICSYNWSEHVLRLLSMSIKKKQDSHSGCVLLLPYWLCERTKLIPEIQPNLFPKFLKWDLGQLNQILKTTLLQKLNQTKIPHRSDQATVEEQALLHCEELHALPQSEQTKDGPPSKDNDSAEEDTMGRMLCRIRKRLREDENPKHVITRTHRSTETSDADDNSNLSVHDISNDTELSRIVEKELHEIYVHQETTSRSNSDCTPLLNQNNSGSNKISEPVLNFKDIKEFEDFKIHVNGENLEAEISSQIQRKYYELCCFQKEFLHVHLTKGLNSKLVAGMIMEIISITDATRTANISTSLENLEQMDKTLNFFEGLGMTVGFLRVRLQSLVKLSRERQTVTNSKKTKLSLVEDERTAMQEKISKMDELMESVTAHGASIGSLEAKIGTLEEKTEEIDKIFKEVANSPW